MPFSGRGDIIHIPREIGELGLGVDGIVEPDCEQVEGVQSTQQGVTRAGRSERRGSGAERRPEQVGRFAPDRDRDGDGNKDKTRTRTSLGRPVISYHSEIFLRGGLLGTLECGTT